MRYIDDVEIRKTIQAATNKSEEFNGFVKWVFFGGEGVIAENVLHEQRKIVKYSQLVANMVILHNVEGMTRTLAELRKRVSEILCERHTMMLPRSMYATQEEDAGGHAGH